ncbi:DUF1256 domain-containing protein, partial [Tyzzerella sp. OttesenSCG-928-J15]|nr:DUF1256 domain-containing protein [Tyzzerella sp. OttesenSCG-928-J15]
MSVILKETMNISINSGEKDAGAVFEGCFKEYLAAVSDDFAEKVLLCIGSERATGDSLGPVTGSMVYEKLGENKL